MSNISNQIFCRDAKGKTRFWQYEVDGGQWRTMHGHLGGKSAVTEWKICVGKNVGRANEKTPEQQAQFEADAEFGKKLDREYRRTEAELDDVPHAPMLAHKFKDYEADLVWPVFSQPKLDGIRALTKSSGSFSREFQRHLNCEHIIEACAPIIDKYPNLLIDGEFYNHDLKEDFNTISSIVRTEKCTDEDRAEAKRLIQYHVYDLFDPGRVAMPFGERDALISSLLNRYADPEGPLRYVPAHMASGMSELNRHYERYLADGYEGQMVRANDAYEPSKRSTALLKRKEWETAEFRMLSINEGVGGWAGRAKSVTFALENGEPCSASVKGNYAYTRSIFNRRHEYAGGEVTVKFAPQRTPDGQLRFAVVTDFHKAGGRKD